MVDEVADGLGNMKLTSDEEEVIPISDEGKLAALESCRLSLIGKFLTCKPFNKRVAKNTLRRAWGLANSLQIIKVVRVFSNSSFKWSLIWLGFYKMARGLLIISCCCFKGGKKI